MNEGTHVTRDCMVALSRTRRRLSGGSFSVDGFQRNDKSVRRKQLAERMSVGLSRKCSKRCHLLSISVERAKCHGFFFFKTLLASCLVARQLACCSIRHLRSQ